MQDYQQRVKKYMETHRIEEIMYDIVNTLTHTLLDEPIIYMIKYLAKFHAKPDDLHKHGISIGSEQLARTILYITPKQLELRDCNLKKILADQDIYLKLKNRVTSFNCNFRQILQLAHEKSERDPIGLYATDPDCYQTYGSLFNAVLNEGCTKQEFSYKKHYERLVKSQIFQEIKPYLVSFALNSKRNVKDHKFNNSLQVEERHQLTNKLIDFLIHSRNFKFQKVVKLDDEDLQTKPPLLDGFTLKNKLTEKKGLRYPHWPKDRAICFGSDQIQAWINKENHLQFKVQSGNHTNIEEVIYRMFELDQELEAGLALSFCPQFGYLNVKPKDTGLGLKMALKFEIEPSLQDQFRINLDKFLIKKDSWFVLKKLQKGQFSLELANGRQLTKNDFILQLQQVLRTLFHGLTQSEITLNQRIDFNFTISEFDTYENQQTQIIDYLKRTYQWQFNPNYDVESLSLKLYDDCILEFNDIIISQRYFVIRRNIQEISTSQSIDEQLEYCFRQEIYQEQSKLYRRGKNKDYDQLVESFVQRLGFKLPLTGTAFFKEKNDKFHVLTNVNDHFIIFVNLAACSISQGMLNVINVVNKIEQGLRLNGYHFCVNQNIGYLTKQAKDCGSAISIHLKINEYFLKHFDQSQLNGQCLSVLSITPQNTYQFVQKVNQLLIKPKKELTKILMNPSKYKSFNMELLGGISQLGEYIHPEIQNKIHNSIFDQIKDFMAVDCHNKHQLWAPSLECFSIFEPLFEHYEIDVLNKIPVKYLDLIYKFKKSDAENMKEVKLDVFASKMENLDLNTKFTFYRNFKNFPFTHLMSLQQQIKLKSDLKTFLTEKGFDIFVLGDVEQFVRNPTDDTKMEIYVCQQSHIQLTVQSSIRSSVEILVTCLKLLDKIAVEFEMAKHDSKGYRGPNLENQTFGGFECEFSLPVANFNMERVVQISKQFCYVTRQEIDKMVLKIDRPGIIKIEMLMLIELLNCVEELQFQ